MAAPKKKITTEPNVRFPNFKIVIENGTENPMVVVSDLNIAAYLKILNYEIYDVRKGNRQGQLDFYFKVLDANDPQEAARDILDFMNNRGRSGRYLDYTDSWKNLKSLMNQF